MSSLDRRCGLCGARGLARTDRYLDFRCGRKNFAHVCSHCGLLYNNPSDDLVLPEMAHGRVLECEHDSPVGFDIFTLKMIASRQGFVVAPADSDQEHALSYPHSSLPGSGTLLSLDTLAPVPLTLGIMCREDDLETVLAKIALVGEEVVESIVVVDQSADWHPESAVPPNVRLAPRQLDRRFDAQRNFIHQLSRTNWVLQLDADEHLDATALNRLRRLTAGEQGKGAVSIGLPRHNFVGDICSDLYPDVQYRLNRREIRYEGAVHERPVRPWQRSLIALGVNMEHRLNYDHVEQRSHFYEVISPGYGRLNEQLRLNEPFRA